MRIYEFSKESGISTKDVLEVLKKEGFDVKSHMSVLSQKELDFLNIKYKTKKAEKETIKEHLEAPKKTEKPETSKEPKVSHVEEKTHKTAEKITESVVQESKPQAIATKTIEKVVVVEPVGVPALEIVLEPMAVSDVALKMGKQVNDIILTLLKWGILSNKNQILGTALIARLAEQYQIKTIKPAPKKTEVTKKDELVVEHGELSERLPVVVVLGHVDHGKTTLLDFIRKTRVAAREKGGITQHVGAYEATTSHGNIVFLDTPGHEAFTKMRMRGIKVADVAILVVAADDGIMPQTVEAIKLAKSMEVPIVVAINKIDKVEPARVEIIKRQLAQYDLLPEEWGGHVVVVPISAKEGTGIDQLLEMILLQTQLMELKADVAGPAKGYVLEAKIEKGRGPVATFLARHGTIKIGDYFICGAVSGRVSSLVNSYGQRVKEVGPSVPVQVAGFEALPEAGDYFAVTSKEELRKSVAPIAERKSTLPSQVMAKENTINLLVKTDANSSKEALLESIEKLSKKSEKGFSIVFAGVGSISESDIVLALNTGAKIIALHVRADQNAASLAQHQGVELHTFDVIYKLLEFLEAMAEAAKEIKLVRKKIGEAYVLRIFDIKNVGVIAGASVREGRFSRDGNVTVWRGNKKIGQGKIKSLQRDKKVVKEVHSGFECAFLVEGITDWAVDDRVECFIEVPEGQ